VFDLSILKIAVLAVLAVLVFGPDKLPTMVADVTRCIRAVQSFSRTSTQELTRELPPEFRDLHVSDLRPRALAGRLVEAAATTVDESGTGERLEASEGGRPNSAATQTAPHLDES
jgi:sec-independent protein translocase protein TatB